ncbi:hypothetical protein JW752_02015 [Candidatus Peregrinibacteria bacterium]|nr:hypothetical protein [Candidatus Peregrinibacteria bacterium]
MKILRSNGFTIAEMFIVTIIAGILMTIGGRIYFEERDRFDFNEAFIQMTGMLTDARNFANTSQGIYVDTLGQNLIPADGYGVYIKLEPDPDTMSTFTLFANLGAGPDHEGYQNDDNDSDAKRFDGNDRVIRTFEIPGNLLHFHSFYFDGEWKWDTDEPEEPTATEAVVIYTPPLADTFIGDNSGAMDSMEELGMKFFNPAAPEDSAKKCQFIRINRIKTFPALEYSADECND